MISIFMGGSGLLFFVGTLWDTYHEKATILVVCSYNKLKTV